MHRDSALLSSNRERQMTTTNTQAQRVKTLRAALSDRYGKGKYKITGHIGSNEQVHIYGKMPNSIETGWWLMGDIAQAESWMGL